MGLCECFKNLQLLLPPRKGFLNPHLQALSEKACFSLWWQLRFFSLNHSHLTGREMSMQGFDFTLSGPETCFSICLIPLIRENFYTILSLFCPAQTLISVLLLGLETSALEGSLKSLTLVGSQHVHFSFLGFSFSAEFLRVCFFPFPHTCYNFFFFLMSCSCFWVAFLPSSLKILETHLFLRSFEVVPFSVLPWRFSLYPFHYFCCFSPGV